MEQVVLLDRLSRVVGVLNLNICEIFVPPQTGVLDVVQGAETSIHHEVRLVWVDGIPRILLHENDRSEVAVALSQIGGL